MKLCKLCNEKHEAMGFCRRHYVRFKKHGLIGINRPYRERLYRKGNITIKKENYYILKAKQGNILVSHKDYEIVRKYTWYIGKNGYVYSNIKGKNKTMHRFILGTKKGKFVDHKNRDKSDNRRENLRECTPSQNNYNKKIQVNNTSGYTGVVYCKQTNKWRAWIYVNKKRIDLGRHKTKKKAAFTYNEAAKKYHGKFSLLNIIL